MPGFDDSRRKYKKILCRFMSVKVEIKQKLCYTLFIIDLSTLSEMP